MFFLEHQQSAMGYQKNVQVVGILGASNCITPFLLESLLKVKDFSKKEGILFKLYDIEMYYEEVFKFLDDTATCFNSRGFYGDKIIVTIEETEEEFISDCDVLILVGDFTQRENEDEKLWLERCFSEMNYLSDLINAFGHRDLRVIFNNHGPIAFMATCLVEFCTIIRPSNIVVVTADEGLSVINAVSETTGTPVARMSAPPVWGFIGINSFVDERNIVVKANVYRPYQRSLTAPLGSTLPLGTMTSELRLASYLIPNHDKIINEVKKREETISSKLDRPKMLAKVRAITSLVQLWYAKEPGDHIISLGVCSNGSLGIPAGIVFSQPVKLNEHNMWVPFTNFPLIDDYAKTEINKCVCSAKNILQQHQLIKLTIHHEEECQSEILDA